MKTWKFSDVKHLQKGSRTLAAQRRRGVDVESRAPLRASENAGSCQLSGGRQPSAADLRVNCSQLMLKR
jgi:hypothetical protein